MGRDLNEFVLANEFDCLFEVEDTRRNQADRLVSGLESTLTLQREVEKTLPENATRINYRQLTDSLTTMVGEYRSLKESRDAARFNQMVRHFNVAVGAVNALNEGD